MGKYATVQAAAGAAVVNLPFGAVFAKEVDSVPTAVAEVALVVAVK